MSQERFDHFMTRALYGPSGYYTSPRPILGARGDFTTTPKLTKELARSIAKWITTQWSYFDSALPIIELGPGDGTLAADIREELSFFQRRKLRYHLVEISPHLRGRQQERIGSKAQWHATLTEALYSTGPAALVISNEFFDAFPIRIFRKISSSFEELFLDSSLNETWHEAHPLPQSNLFDHDWNEGQRIEIAESIHQWMKDELSALKRGKILTIDYGGSAKENYHRRPAGTLRAYFHHQLLLPPEAYQNPGHQDLTFDLNFDDLISWGKELGFTASPLLTQADFSPNAGLSGADEAFKVLEQSRSWI